MNFQKLVAIIGAAMIVAVLVIVAVVMTAATQTAYGRDQLRNLIVTRVAPSVHGTMFLGRMTGGLLTGVTIDSIEIRDRDDSLFLASGKISLRYDPRDLLDGRLMFSRVEIERPTIVIRQHENGDWNYRRVFPSRKKSLVPNQSAHFGSLFVIDSAIVRDASYILTMPWHPDDSLSGARRDSAIRHNLNSPEREIRRTKEGLARTWRWTGAMIAMGRVRMSHPDTAGRAFEIRKLSVNESDPPMRLRNVAGDMHWLGDSIWFDVHHFDLPASTGHATGKVVWGSEKPVRYAVNVVGDSVSLSDVAWVYPTLPRDGGGSMNLAINNNPRDLHTLEYAITNMDVRSQDSHLRGAMTFAVGGPVLVVKDVNVEALPADLKLLRTFNGKPFPYDWQGQLRGIVKARGGPVNRFIVDDARLVFNDANVPGALSRFSGHGELDILFPAFTKFRGFTTDVAQLDLRTIQYVNPEFPRVAGTVNGHAVLDSSWLDVRFHDAEMTHHDGPDLPSHFTGRGRVTLGDEFMTYDLDMNAAPLSFTTLARSYAAIPIRGPYEGKVRVQGTLNNLVVTSALSGLGGKFAVDGTFDAYPPKLGAHANLQVANLDLRALLDRDNIPHTDITGRISSTVTGDSLQTLDGTVAIDLERSLIDKLELFDSRARLVLGGGRVRVDTIALHSTAATLAANGALGLSMHAPDSLRLVINMDSLGGLRRYLRARKRPNAEGVLPSTTVAETDPKEIIRDSLAGAARVDVILRGSLDMLSATGTVDGRAFFVYGDEVERATGSFQIQDVLGRPNGQLALRLDTAVIAGIRLDSLATSIALLDPEHMHFHIATLSGNGPTAAAAGSVARVADTTAVTLDTVLLRVGRSRWTLPAPAALKTTPTGLELVNFRLRNGSGGWLELGGTLPLKHEVQFVVRADSVPLADLGALAQMPAPLGGLGMLQWEIKGHREDPRMVVRAELRDVRYSGVNLERVEMRGAYVAKRLADTLVLYRGGKAVLNADASLPVDLALLPVDKRLVGDSLSGSIRADSVELAVLEAFTPLLQHSTGTLVTNVRLGGTLTRPLATGTVAVVNGSATLLSAGVQLERINANISLNGDIARIERFTMQSGTERGDTASLLGYINFKRFDNPEFGLNFTARSFRVIGRRSIADLQVTTPGRTPISLEGEFKHARLTGSLLIERGTIFIPELAEKRLTDLNDPSIALINDTTRAARALLPDAPSELVENLELQGVKIRIGDDVWIRSAEANIKLSGDVDVTRTHDPRVDNKARLALFGTLNADRGTYRLNLGIVQRTFDLENGTVRFFGDADLNPTMDINALHVVRQSGNKQDIRIRVHLGGTLLPPPGPELAFSSADGYRIDQPQLLSYLITGAPTFETAEIDESVTQKAVGVALRSAGGYLSSRLTGALGLDVIQVQTSGISNGLLRPRQAGSAGLEYLRNTRIGVGKQLNERLFVSANTGLCKFDPAKLTSSDYLESIGVKVDYRLPKDLVVSGGTEPGAMALICDPNGGQQLRGFISTPRQWGFDLSKTWKF